MADEVETDEDEGGGSNVVVEAAAGGCTGQEVGDYTATTGADGCTHTGAFPYYYNP